MALSHGADATLHTNCCQLDKYSHLWSPQLLPQNLIQTLLDPQPKPADHGQSLLGRQDLQGG